MLLPDQCIGMSEDCMRDNRMTNRLNFLAKERSVSRRGLRYFLSAFPNRNFLLAT
jgi:hypothetical protein